MGTPPASDSLDQMRRMQVASSGGGECARIAALADTAGAIASCWGRKLIGGVATSPRTCCLAAPLCRSGCDAGPVFSFDTAQQVMFAQHPGLQASLLGAFDRMHGAAGIRSGVTNTASATVNRIAAVLRINLWIAPGTARVEQSGERTIPIKAPTRCELTHV